MGTSEGMASGVLPVSVCAAILSSEANSGAGAAVMARSSC